MIAAALRAMGYHGTVGLEAYASGDDERALERFRTAFAHAAPAADVAPGSGTAGSGTAQ